VTGVGSRSRPRPATERGVALRRRASEIGTRRDDCPSRCLQRAGHPYRTAAFSGRVRPAGSPLTSPPDPDQTRRTRRTADPVRREKHQPGPGSAQEPAEPPPREARPPGDAVPHASRSRDQYMSTGWRRQRALPEGEPPVLLGEFCGRMARGSSKEAAPSAGTARGYSSQPYAAGVLECQVRAREPGGRSA